jgi:HD superfamily phosphohydrolase
MTRSKNVLDPVWGKIELTDLEWQVIGTAWMQRLRRIHQLGLTNLVFPGATHTRFEHSLGACHAAGQIARTLLDTPPADREVAFESADSDLVRMAALLHDIGHGPFSHVSDPLFEGTSHEEIGALIVESDPELVAIIPEEVRDGIARILRSEKPRTVQRDIVSGPADADKVDYLLRDSYYAGVNTGRFDADHLIDQVKALSSKPDTLLGFRASGLYSVEGMLLARHHMHRTVYGHRNRLITDLMLQKAMRRAIDEGWLPIALFRPPSAGVSEFLELYTSWDDWRLMTQGVTAEGRSGAIFRRLRDHRLLKLLVYLEDEEFSEALGDEGARLLSNRGSVAGLADKLEPRLVARLGVDEDSTIVRMDDPQNPIVRHAGALRSQDIIIERSSGRKVAMSVASEIFNSIPRATNRTRLYVYAEKGRKEDSAFAALARDEAVTILNAILQEES